METQVQLEDDLQLPAGFKANTGNGSNFEYRKLPKADGELIERLLPQWGSLSQTNDIGVFSKLHYGWKVRNPSDPTKTMHRTFLCIEEKQNGMIVKACPACELIKTYQAKFEAIKDEEKAKLNTVRTKAAEKNLTEDQLNKALAKVIEEFKQPKQDLADWLKDHNTDRKVRLHTVNKAGVLGVLALPYGTFKLLKKEKAEIEKRDYPASVTKKRGIPVQANGMCGVFFKITRTGRASLDSDKVVVNKILDQESGTEAVDYHKVTREFLEQAQRTLPDLVKMAEDCRLSGEQIQKLVDHCVACNGSCDPDTVEKIMGPRVASKPVEAPKVEPVKAVEVVKAEPAKEPVTPKVEVKEPVKTSQNMADATDDEFDDLFK